MNDELKQHCDRLQEELKIAETCLARVGQRLASPEAIPLAEWKVLLQEATAKCSEMREQARQAGERFKVWMEESENRKEAPFEDSNLDGEVTRAEKQAELEEGVAQDAMRVAAYASLQAEVAILKAFTTRKRASDLARFKNEF